MNTRSEFKLINTKNNSKVHKGFYHDADYEESLRDIEYGSLIDEEYDDNFPYTSADLLLTGGCNFFALALSETLSYRIFIIEESEIQKTHEPGWHAFCQTHKNGSTYYIDARGMTTSFDEFLFIAKRFVPGEYVICLATKNDVKEWRIDEFCEKAVLFSKAVIREYFGCYSLLHSEQEQ